MKIYWNLTEKERSELTSDQVETFVRAELMTLGILKPEPCVLDPVPPVPKPTQQYFHIRCGDHPLDVAFDRIEDAKSFLNFCQLRIDRAYVGHAVHSVAVRIEPMEIVSSPMFSQEEFASAKDILRSADAIVASNKKKQGEYQAAEQKRHEALRNLMDDWNECRSKAIRLKRVVDTFSEYKDIAGGDGGIAARFLAKVFTRSAICEAAQWFGEVIEVPDDAPEMAPAEQQKAVAYENPPF